MNIRRGTNHPRPGFQINFDKKNHYFQLLEKASRLVLRDLDYKLTIQNIIDVLLDGLSTGCYLSLIDQKGRIQPEFVAFKKATKVVFKRHLIETNSEVSKCLTDVAINEISILCSPLSCGQLADCNHKKILNELNSGSFVCIPLKARNIMVGALLLESREFAYDFQDLEFMSKFSNIVALAIDNARIFKNMQEAVKVRDEFFANLSHELRSPLSVIQGWVKVLQSENLDRTNFQKVLKTLEKNSDLQASLVKELVDVSRISVNKLNLDKKNINLIEIVNNAFEALELNAREKNILFNQDCCDVPLIVSGDGSNLQRVFLNIIGNAIKFTPNNGLVNVTLRSEEGYAIVEIKDSGCGITEKFILKIFKSFCQENSCSPNSRSGLGLGLTIAKKIVELHEGEIKASSPGKNKGSSFEVKIPLVKDTTRRLKKESLPQGNQGEKLKGITILIVDDSEDVRFLLSRYIMHSGAKILEAESAGQAYQFVKEKRPDIILCDIAMPIEDGQSLIKKLRRLPADQGGNIKAIALTAYVDLKIKRSALASGFDMYLTKPIFQEELIDCLIKALR